MGSINYLFPPDQIHNLPTWRFVLHFMVTPQFDQAQLPRAVERLKAAEWRIVVFPSGHESLSLDRNGRMVSVPIEVPDDRRRRPNSLTQYESDVWKIMGNMARCGFGDVYYEAVDWHEDADGKSGSTDQERPFQSLQHETTKRWAILEDNGTSAWLYITEPATFRLHSLRSTKSRATVERLRLRALMGIHGTRRGLWRPFGRWKEP